MGNGHARQTVREAERDEQDGDNVQPYELTAVPNDFNTITMVNFIESNVFDIPDFQRNYVWDKKRASRLIESAILGIPIPQVFLYEHATNKFLVVDGQQRLMSIYYFVKGRFPIKKKIHELRTSLGGGKITLDRFLNDNEYFGNFALDLPEYISGDRNPLDKLRYVDLSSTNKNLFDMRTIRNVVVRQTNPDGHNSMYEMFNRLNSGGVNLVPQEIRKCLYDSDFYKILYAANTKPEWRRFLNTPTPDLHMKDVEWLLRGFAMLIQKPYRPPLVKFLNDFSHTAKSFDGNKIDQLQKLLESFLSNNKRLQDDAFHSPAGRFSSTIFESVFVAACVDSYDKGGATAETIDGDLLNGLKGRDDFRTAAHTKTTDTRNVKNRLDLAYKALVDISD